MIPEQPDAEEAEAILAGLDGLEVWITWFVEGEGILNVSETVAKLLAATKHMEEGQARAHCQALLRLWDAVTKTNHGVTHERYCACGCGRRITTNP